MFDKMTRNILASKPRVTRFKINWDDINGTGEEQIDTEDGAGTSGINQPGHNLEFDDLAMGEPQDENSLVMPGNENSNSLAMMEC